MSLVVRKMAVPITAPIVMSAPSHAPSTRTRRGEAPVPVSRRARSEAIGARGYRRGRRRSNEPTRP
jgi:hypothetical protein